MGQTKTETRPAHPTLTATAAQVVQINDQKTRLIERRFKPLAEVIPHIHHDKITDIIMNDAVALLLAAQWFGHSRPIEAVKRGLMTFPAIIDDKERMVFVSALGRIRQVSETFLFIDGKEPKLPSDFGVLVARGDPKRHAYHFLGYTVSNVGWTHAERRRFRIRKRDVWSLNEAQLSNMDQLERDRIGGELELAV